MMKAGAGVGFLLNEYREGDLIQRLKCIYCEIAPRMHENRIKCMMLAIMLNCFARKADTAKADDDKKLMG